MKHFHNYTVPCCNCNYPFEDGDDSPVRRRAEIKDDSERERERGRRGEDKIMREQGGRKGRREEEGEGDSHKENNVLVKC